MGESMSKKSKNNLTRAFELFFQNCVDGIVPSSVQVEYNNQNNPEGIKKDTVVIYANHAGSVYPGTNALDGIASAMKKAGLIAVDKEVSYIGSGGDNYNIATFYKINSKQHGKDTIEKLVTYTSKEINNKISQLENEKAELFSLMQGSKSWADKVDYNRTGKNGSFLNL